MYLDIINRIGSGCGGGTGGGEAEEKGAVCGGVGGAKRKCGEVASERGAAHRSEIAGGVVAPGPCVGCEPACGVLGCVADRVGFVGGGGATEDEAFAIGGAIFTCPQLQGSGI